MANNIAWENRGGIGILTLNRPAKSNALNRELLAEVWDKLQSCQSDHSVRVLVLRAAGNNFCTGGDLEGHPFFQSQNTIDKERYIREAQRIVIGLQRLPQPTIAAIRGVAGGAGLDLALGCDLRIVAENARLGVFFTRVGLMPDMGGTYMLPRLVGVAKALELLYTGDLIDAQEALRIGLVNKIVPTDALDEKVLEIGICLARGPARAYRLGKWTVYRNLGLGLEAALEQEVLGQMLLVNTEDFHEGLRAFSEKRAPHFKDV